MSSEKLPTDYDAHVTISVTNNENNKKIYRDFHIKYNSGSNPDDNKICQKVLKKAVADVPSIWVKYE